MQKAGIHPQQFQATEVRLSGAMSRHSDDRRCHHSRLSRAGFHGRHDWTRWMHLDQPAVSALPGNSASPCIPSPSPLLTRLAQSRNIEAPRTRGSVCLVCLTVGEWFSLSSFLTLSALLPYDRCCGLCVACSRTHLEFPSRSCAEDRQGFLPLWPYIRPSATT